MIPVLLISYNRLEYTKKAFEALMNCRHVFLHLIDNGSTDGTVEWLKTKPWYRFSLPNSVVHTRFNAINIGIAGAMNQFLDNTKSAKVVGKVDNDTVVPADWIEKMIPHLATAEILQAKHHLIKASGVGTFDEWTSKMPADGPLRFNHFVGGSGIIFKRSIVDRIPETDWKLGGWRQWQKQHPEFKKAFVTDVEIELLDTNENGADYSKYPNYYQETGRT